MHTEPDASRHRALLRLLLTPGIGPRLAGRLLHTFGTAEAAVDAPIAALREIRGIGSNKASKIHDGIDASAPYADEELERIAATNVTLLAINDPSYPPLLRQIPGAPPLLYVRGLLDPELDRYTVAVVGSRRCTPYGLEQTSRFAGHLAERGLTIVSGGARGIDTAAHRAALRHGGRTVVVTGCGLNHCYPPENADLFEQIVAEGRGAIVTELPLNVGPAPENFPPRNRIISGLSLGVLLIEAAAASGARITARQAVEEHGREVMALPGRVDSPASEGSLDLLKRSSAHLVTEPTDVLDILESPARQLFAETATTLIGGVPFGAQQASPTASKTAAPAPLQELKLTETQRTIFEALAEPRTFDELTRDTNIDAATLRAEATVLEIRKLIERRGQALVRR